jgi:Secretion system C-terminal sorting domain
MKIITISILLLIAVTSFAQPPQVEWTRTWSFDDQIDERREGFECVRALPDGGLILAGRSEFNLDDETSVVFRLDAEGNEVWSQQYVYRIYDLAVLEDGGIVGCGLGGFGSASLVKFNSDGSIVWNLLFDGESKFVEVRELPNGNLLVCTNGGAFSPAVIYYLFDENGILLDSTPEVNVGKIAGFDLTGSGGTIVAYGGLGYDSGSFYLIKTNELGQHVWQTRVFHSQQSMYSWPDDVITVSSGGYVACGFDEHEWISQPALAKVDQDGAILWRNSYPVAAASRLHEVVETGDRGLLAAGWMHDTGSYLLRTESNGARLWQALVDDSLSVESLDIARDGGAVLAGYRMSPDGDYDMHAIKLAPEVQVALAPETQVVPAEGGTIHFDATLTHTLVRESQVFALQRVVLPDGTQTDLEPIPLQLIPGEDRAFTDLPVSIPAEAPAGVYHFEVRVGRQNTGRNLGFATFAFEKLSEAQSRSSSDRLTLLATPNPFNPTTTISLHLPTAEQANVRVLNMLGREVVTLHSGTLQGGEHAFVLDGSSLSSGVYFVRASIGGENLHQKVLLMK